MEKIIGILAVSLLLITGCNTAMGNSTGNNNKTSTVSSSKVTIPKLSGPKKRIAVVKFEDKSGNTWYNHDVGTGMADMLVTALVKSENFTVVERETFDKVMEEQKLGASGFTTAGSAAKIGKILGANVLITGSVTEFGTKDGGGSVGGLGGLTGGLVSGVGVKNYTARVAVDIKLIDVSTGQIITAETAFGERSEGKLNFDSWKLPDFKMGSNNFDTSLIGKATRDAINTVVVKVSGATAKTPWKGYILKAEGEDIWITAGTTAGIKTGMKFKVQAQGEEMEDAEGNIYVIPGAEIAEVEVIQPLDKLSKVKVVSGSGIKKDMMIIEVK